MLFFNDDLFFETRLAKIGQLNLPPALDQLRNWLDAEFGIRVVHVVFDRPEPSSGFVNPRLTVIVEADIDYQILHHNELEFRLGIREKILGKFIELSLAELDPSNTEGVFLIVDKFSDECLNRACKAFRENDRNQITEEFATAPIWEIDGFSKQIVVFFGTEEDIYSNKENGTCERISQEIFKRVKQYDEFGYLNPSTFHLKFDSKEIVDKNFGGNLFNYWR